MRVSVSGTGLVNLPDFIVPGSAKAGTTAAWMLLRGHPEVFVPDVKEPRFFSAERRVDDSHPDRHDVFEGAITDIREYAALYETAPDSTMLGDFSPTYLYKAAVSVKAIKQIYSQKNKWKHIRFIVFVRNPVEVAWSLYWSNRRFLKEHLDFRKAISESIHRSSNPYLDYVGFASYSSGIETYMNAFPRENILTVLSEDFRKDNVATVRSILHHLNCDDSYTPPDSGADFNPSGRPRSRLLTFLIFGNSPLAKTSRLLPAQIRHEIKLQECCSKRWK